MSYNKHTQILKGILFQQTDFNKFIEFTKEICVKNIDKLSNIVKSFRVLTFFTNSCNALNVHCT